VNRLGRPGDFPIGSRESRAAARIQLSRRIDTRERTTIALSMPRPGQDRTRVQFDPWRECPDGTLWRLVYVPLVWLKPGDPIPTCPDCGTPFKKTSDYTGISPFHANCVAKHDPDLNGQSKSSGLFR